ncbi:MAG: helix-turn-helix transcriptional regulator [Actinomycetota bacterium]
MMRTMSEDGIRSVSVPPGWQGTLALGSGIVAYHGPGLSADLHRHDAIQAIWSFGGDLRLAVGQDLWVVRAAIVPTRVPHAILASSGETVIALVEPRGTRGVMLDRFAQDHLGRDVSTLTGPGSPPPRDDATSLIEWSARAIGSFTPGTMTLVRSDMRSEVVGAMRYVDGLEDGVPRLADASRFVGLSTRQLSRSFSSEVGMPFQRYVLWSRLRRAARVVQRGGDLTMAAHTAGFSDSAHFSRVFRSTFGLPPSSVLPVLEIIDLDDSGW